MGYRVLVAAVGLVALALSGSPAAAVPIQVTITATGSGTIGTTPFNGAAFTLHLSGDTAARRTINPNINDIPLTTALIEIAGVGTAAFTVPTRVFVNRSVFASSSAAGFSLESGNDILNVEGAGFATWDMTTDVGPVFNANPYPLNQAQNLPTTLGELDFTAYSNATFTADVVPEPAAAAGLSVSALAALVARRPRCRRHA